MSWHRLGEKLRREIARAGVQFVQRVRILYYRCITEAKITGKPILSQPLLAVGQGEIIFSGKVRIGYFASPSFLSTHAYLEARTINSKVIIGEGTLINNSFTAIAEHTTIRIGKRVLIGTNVEIIDSDFHGIRIDDRMKSLPDWAKPVIIEDDVFIGSNVRILKGVTIGRGSVVANSSVVSASIPAYVIAAGHPAQIVRSIS